MALDLLTFAWAVPHVGIEAESNPLMMLAYARIGLIAVGILKVAFTVVILFLLRLGRSSPRFRLVAASLGASIGLIGAVSNVIAWRSM